MARIVVVDDSKISRNMIKSILESNGHEVVCEATNGLEGYDKYKEHRPDLITLDINMPIMSGMELLRMLKKNFPESKVIMMTASGQKTKVEEAGEIGADGYIAKPFSEDMVVEVVNSVLGK